MTTAPAPASTTHRDDAGGRHGTAATPPVPVAVERLSVSFGALTVLDRIDLAVPAGSVVGVVGPSGCGKSTLLSAVAGLRAATAGTIAVGDASTPQARLDRCALMTQRDLLLPWLRAVDNAAVALTNAGARRSAARATALPLLADFGLEGFEHAYPAELSGGMRQRVAFIRTLLAGKPVLLLDEPFAALDAITRAEMQGWLARRLAGAGHTVVLVTHDVEEALYLCDRVAVLTPRPARVAGWLEGPSPRADDRAGAVSDPSFVEARREALELLGALR